MASIYERKDSPFLWISFKDQNGKWKAINSGFRKDNLGGRKQAKNLANKKSLEEAINKSSKASGSAWSEWSIAWINSRWGDPLKPNSTAHAYLRRLRNWLRFFEDKDIHTPAHFRREHIDQFLAWRKGVGRNTALMEIKFLAMLLDEAIARGYLSSPNPARNLRLKSEPAEEKSVWSDDEIAIVQTALERDHRYDWLHVTFLMGLHQAVRLRQSAIPLSCIDFNRRLINWPDSVVKGHKGYAQPISPAFFDTLKEIVMHRRAIKKSTLCDIPSTYKDGDPASVQWRRFLDSLNLPHLVHHGLRATWITQAALRGVPESLAMRFVNHASRQVHAIYQKITATDLMPMLDAFLLAKPNALALPPK